MKKCMMILFLVCFLSLPVSAAITHRYPFEGNDPNDVIAGLVGTLVGNAAVSGGSLVLDGTDDLLEMDGPGTAINTYDAFSLEMWYTPVNGVVNTGNTMLAYFGGNNSSATWMGINYFFMTSARQDDFSRAALSTGNTGDPWVTESGVNGPELDDNIQHHMVATLTDTEVSFFIDGEYLGTTTISGTNNKDNISQDLALLGRGGYLNDPEWNGSIQEFRIYDKALTAAEMRFTENWGPDNAYPIVIRSTTPAYGQTLVSRTPGLEWTLETGITADQFDLYLGTDPNIADPNISDVSGISKLVKTGLLTPGYTLLDTEQLPFDQDIYWRVDTVAGSMTYQGVGTVFTTIPESPAFRVNPVSNYLFAGETAVFTVQCESISPVAWVKWYKVGTPDTEVTTADPDVTIVTTTDGDFTTSTLSIANVATADAGSYYAKALNAGGTGTSANGLLVIKRLLARYEFEGNANDSSGSGLHGTILTPSGAPATATYVASTLPGMGQAISFTGTGVSNPSNTTDPYVDLPDGFSDFSHGITISAWAYPTATVAWQRICQFGNGTNGANNSFYFTRVGTGSTLRFENDNTNPSSATSLTSGNNGITTGAWQHLVVTVNTNATNNAVLYRNGLPIATGTITLPNVVTRTNCYIGRSEWYGDYLFRGQMDDVRLYNYGLTADDVAKMYSDVAGPFCQIRPAYDLNNDCFFNLADIAIFAAQWAECGLYPSVECP